MTILLIILGLGFVIIVHELGHFIFAKKNGVRVEIFSVGFGPAIWKRQAGETEYRISAIPLGGYVKLSGELPTPDATPEPHELHSKSRWARLQIFAAGAVFNIFFAIPLSCLSFMTGRLVPEAIFTTVPHAEASAGIKPGDRIVKINNEEIRHANEYKIKLLSYDKTEPINVTVDRLGRQLTFQVQNNWEQIQHVNLNSSNKVLRVVEGSIADRCGLKAGDKIVSINGIQTVSLHKIINLLDESAGSEATIIVERDTAYHTLKMNIPPASAYTIPADYNMVAPVIGKTSLANSLKEGDIITKIDGVDIESWQDIKNALKGKGGKQVVVTVTRGAEPMEFLIRTLMDEDGNGLLGISLKETSYVANVPAGSFFASIKCNTHDKCTGLIKGDKITQFDRLIGEVPTSRLGGTYEDSSEKVLQFLRNGATHTARVAPVKKTTADLAALGLMEKKEIDGAMRSELLFEYNSKVLYYGVLDSIKNGVIESVEVFEFTVASIKKLFVNEVPLKEIAGPIGIMDTISRGAQTGIGNYLWILVIITVNLGILNLFPIPALDGGHIALLAFDSVSKLITGKPLSERFIMVFQYIGIALLLSLVILATYNDIGRLIGA